VVTGGIQITSTIVKDELSKLVAMGGKLVAMGGSGEFFSRFSDELLQVGFVS
jgi:hypothetical protein